MAELSKYNIAFKGLALGVHEFEYQIGKQFFDHFDKGITEEGDLTVKVRLEKQSSLMVLWFFVKGIVKVQCDRCLEIYDQIIESENSVYVKYGEEAFDEGDDVIWVSPNDYQINVGKMIYDFILLSLPIRLVHPDDENSNSLCNPDMIRKLETLTVKKEGSDKKTDSRWDDLRKLLENE